MKAYLVYTAHPQEGAVKQQSRLIGSLPVPPDHILSYLKGRPWNQLPADVQQGSHGSWGTRRRKPKKTEWPIPIYEPEWRCVQKSWSQQSPRLVLIKSTDQLLTDVAEITGGGNANGGDAFGVSFNFALDITGVFPDDIHIEGLYNETRRHFLLAKSCLRQIKTLNGQLPTAVVDDFADLEITLDEFFTEPQQSVPVEGVTNQAGHRSKTVLGHFHQT